MNFTASDEAHVTLKARFDNINGYFRLEGFDYYLLNNPETETFLRTKDDITFPYNFSYHCRRESIFYDKSSLISLKLLNFQVQMDSKKFDAVYDCVGYMSISIWTGVFVIAILSIIMIWGLLMIMDIRTMDHFDDPKGKTITIATQD